MQQRFYFGTLEYCSRTLATRTTLLQIQAAASEDFIDASTKLLLSFGKLYRTEHTAPGVARPLFELYWGLITTAADRPDQIDGEQDLFDPPIILSDTGRHASLYVPRKACSTSLRCHTRALTTLAVSRIRCAEFRP